MSTTPRSKIGLIVTRFVVVWRPDIEAKLTLFKGSEINIDPSDVLVPGHLNLIKGTTKVKSIGSEDSEGVDQIIYVPVNYTFIYKDLGRLDKQDYTRVNLLKPRYYEVNHSDEGGKDIMETFEVPTGLALLQEGDISFKHSVDSMQYTLCAFGITERVNQKIGFIYIEANQVAKADSVPQP